MHVTRLFALAVVAVIVLAATPLDAGPRRGRVVRVERPRRGVHGVARICQLREADAGMCWGKPPIRGETASVIDSRRNRGQIQIGEVQASDVGNCAMPTYWTFAVDDKLGADLKDLEPWQTWLLIDVEVGAEAHVLTGSVKAPDDQNAWLAVDRGRASDGDAADFVVTAYQCDENGTRQITGNYTGYCLDYWTLDGGRWSQLRRDIVANCRP